MTEQHRQSGELNVVGLIQEQHPARARLFMKWKSMEWPVLVDSLDLLGIAVVPVTLLIDEHGVVRHRVPTVARGQEIFEQFMATDYAAPDSSAELPSIPELDPLRDRAESGASGGWRDYADALVLWGGESRLDEALEGYRRAVESDPQDGAAEFRQGVARRVRYDRLEQPDDFRAAVEHWTRALELDPNNYIWRRRIQQYGPRLGKPYPFYDWVREARAELQQRGEEIPRLEAEPRGAEIAIPLKQFEPHGTPGVEPDPEGRIRRDQGEFVAWDAAVVPARVEPGTNARVHLELRPGGEKPAHWNNEVGGVTIWLSSPAGWRLERRRLEYPAADAPVSHEVRRMEFEFSVPEQARGGTLQAYALYYVCEEVHGSCLYRRQDLTLEIPVASPAESR